MAYDAMMADSNIMCSAIQMLKSILIFIYMQSMIP